MARRPRPLSEHDRAAWAGYVQHVKALVGRAVPPPPEPPKPARPSPKPSPTPLPKPRQSPPTLQTGHQPPGLDNATWGKFRGGKMQPVRTLDLHGKTAQIAFHTLENFLLQAYAEQARCVEVITGRGSGEQGGILRRELPIWLQSPALRPLVLAVTHPHARNQGSLRILLRRPKP